MKRLRPWLLLAVLCLPALTFAGDVIDTYALDREAVQSSVLGVFRGGWYVFDVTPALRKLPASERAGAVRALGEFARAYVESPAFKTEYAKAWKATKPRGFGLPSLDAGSLARAAVNKARGGGDDASRTALDKDPNVTLKRRLQEFLDVSADVDFGAATTGSGSSRRFTSEAYEAKPAQWKMCFRAGKEATEAARAFAQEWLESLPAK